MDTDQLLVPSSLLHAQISMAFLIFANFVVNAVEAQMRPNPAKEVPSILNKVRSMKFCPFHCCGGNVELAINLYANLVKVLYTLLAF
jgi:hypothetical protein